MTKSVLEDYQPIHVVGIGGAGMSGIARILLAKGIEVSGSDAKDSRRLAALQALGARIELGHSATNLGEARTVLASTAIPETNPELSAAREQGITVWRRAEGLAAIMADSRGVAVSGTHGKTTTTSMLTVALQHCSADPSFVIGSELNESGSNAYLGTGEYFIAEADESDGTFKELGAIAGIVTNVEADHLDHWGDFAAIEAGFDEFVQDICSRDGFAVICVDDPGGAALAQRSRAAGLDIRTYGESEVADNRVAILEQDGQGWQFEVSLNGVKTRPIQLSVPGRHNALNATAALVCGIGLGFNSQELVRGLEAFSGTRRRFEFRGEVDGVVVYDDYAHHPTEIAATLQAAREMTGVNRVIVAFQAHHYYRTALFNKEFGAALGLADEVVILEVFAPGEEPIPGASGKVMAANVPLAPELVTFEPSWSKVPACLAKNAQPGDMIMTLGAGDISMMAPEILNALYRRRSAGEMAPGSGEE